MNLEMVCAKHLQCLNMNTLHVVWRNVWPGVFVLGAGITEHHSAPPATDLSHCQTGCQPRWEAFDKGLLIFRSVYKMSTDFI